VQDFIANAERLFDEYRAAVRGIGMTDLGVLFSEVFFIRAVLGDDVPERIVESGRARGMSTLLLSVCLPRTRIVSIEYDGDSPNEAFARERLAGRDNVELWIGDSRELMPKLLEPGDVAIVDGPKEYRGLKLAFRLLQQRRPRCVFVHDCHQGSIERGELEHLMPHAFYSDDPEFERRFASLDEAYREWEGATRDDAWYPHRFHGREQPSYGPTYACIPYDASVPWGRAQLALKLRAIGSQMRRSMRKRLGRTEPLPS